MVAVGGSGSGVDSAFLTAVPGGLSSLAALVTAN